AGRGGPGKPRSGRPRSCPKENGPAAAAQRPPAPQNGPTGADAPAQTKGKRRGAARGSPGAAGTPPASQDDPAGTGATVKTKGKARGAARGAPKAGAAPAKLVAMDCEMVGTGPGGRTSALARCSIVSYEGD
ncbi:AEN nuclease, partial [Rhipidura dahli]|nr:AEN nuclease [Rhipidura dahli]